MSSGCSGFNTGIVKLIFSEKKNYHEMSLELWLTSIHLWTSVQTQEPNKQYLWLMSFVTLFFELV